jgi:hypothetical protein
MIVAVPAPDDLGELRQAVQGRRDERDRGAALIAEHQPFFAVRDKATLREQHTVSGGTLHDLLRGTYRGERASEAARADALDSLTVTLASDLYVFTRR